MVQRDVTRSMKDPDSARFGNIAAAKSGQGAVIVCGFVNGKNSFGGYTGEVPFMGILKSSGYLVLDIASTENEYRAMIKTCRKEGVAI
ncbi:hypothetical protein [Paenirhodobacter populi]|uniref:hypothetical protein n=1 Tax=Paenirhodobacter populi TaxID=2306993 RepID=UPI0013E3102D|nr:hypothetical protein [Sinirhodobacter populi]